MICRILDGRTKIKLEKFVVTLQKPITHCKVLINSNFREEYQNIISLPWLLTKQQSNDIKEVIQKIRFSTGFSSNIQNILTKNGDFGVKTHDWNTFIKVIIYLYNFHLVHIFSNCGLLFGI